MTRILLVEDDPVTQDIIRSLLESRGHTVDAASDGFTGLKLLRQHDYAAVLVDYHLPEMDGFALARLMRDVGGGRESGPKLVGITADRHGLAARRGSDAVFDATLSKPLTPDTLFKALDHLRAAGLPAAPPAQADNPALAAADRLWRQCGLDGRPRAFCVPPPSAEQAEALKHCFVLAGNAGVADVVLLLGRREAEPRRHERFGRAAFLVPIVDVSGCRLPEADLIFTVTDYSSWRDVASAIGRFRDRREVWTALASRPGAPSGAAASTS